MRKIKIAIFAVVCILFSQTVVLAKTEENSTNIDLYARAAVLMDARTGRVLFDKNGMEKLPMASTTKIMTCILALEHGNPDDYVEVSAYAASMPKVKLSMRAGEYYRLEDLLYSLMLESHNDSAVAIAEHIAGSVEEFAVLMNQKARDIGCNDTCFITPNGLDAASTDGSRVHSTTAHDLALIMSYCISDSPAKEKFLQITGTPSYQFINYKKGDDETEYIKSGRNFSLSNHNAFLNMMEGALSGKTGFTSKAGYCYVGSLKRDDRVYVVALLACGWPNHKSYKWADTRELMDYGLENYFYRDIFTLPAFDKIEVASGIPASGRPYGPAYTSISADTHGENEMQWLLRTDEEVEIKVQVAERLEAPVAAGDKVGQIRYILKGEVLKEYPVVADTAVEKTSFSWVFFYLCRLFYL